MKVILYMAISVNGYITHGGDDSDWVANADWIEFNKLLTQTGVVVMGRRTYAYFGEEFPVKGALNVVMTHSNSLLQKTQSDQYLFTSADPKQVLNLIEQRGFKEIMLIGGESLNTSFLKENLVNEIWLSIHPVFIGKGKQITLEFNELKSLEFISTKTLPEGLIQVRYKIP